MGDFYQVIKTIKGHRYVYRQRTFRMGGRVKTESHYLRKASAADVTRISREIQARQTGPNNVRVRAMFKILCDPARAAPEYEYAWDEQGPVNTTFDPLPEVHSLLRAHKVKLDLNSTLAGHHRGLDVVLMPPMSHFRTQEGYYATLFHELTHWAGEPGRVPRIKGRMGPNATDEERERYAREEVVAEATAMLVMAELGHHPKRIAHHVLYFQTWLGRCKGRQETLDYAMDEAQRAASFLLAVNTTN